MFLSHFFNDSFLVIVLYFKFLLFLLDLIESTEIDKIVNSYAKSLLVNH